MKHLLFIFALLLTTDAVAADEADTWTIVVEHVGAGINRSESLYGQHNSEETRRVATARGGKQNGG